MTTSAGPAAARRSAAPRRAPGRRADVGGDTRERLLAAAARLFAERGPDAVSVRDVCAAARANVAAVNYHFGGKDGLYAETLRTAVGRMLGRVRERLRPDETDAVLRLCGHVRAMTGALLGREADAVAPRLILRELARPSTALRRVVEEFMRPCFEDLRERVAAVATPEARRAGLDLHVLGAVAFVVHCRNAAPVVRAQLGYGAAYPTDFADRAADHVLRQLLLGAGRADLLPVVEASR